MNTVAEFYECVLEAERDNAFMDSTPKDDDCGKCADDCTLSITHTEESSFDSMDMNISQRSTWSEPTRRLTFHETVQVREFCLTVGDHPLGGELPISLDWNFCNSQFHINCSKSRGIFYEPPRRLSIEERRQRLLKVAKEGDLPAEVVRSTSNGSTSRGLLENAISKITGFLSGFVTDAFVEEEEDYEDVLDGFFDYSDLLMVDKNGRPISTSTPADLPEVIHCENGAIPRSHSFYT